MELEWEEVLVKFENGRGIADSSSHGNDEVRGSAGAGA
jgi:hypothetical protein